MSFGFVGLGRMDAHIAHNLARSDHDLTLWTRSGDKARELGLLHLSAL
ncbi:MAG: NAD(P)-binding domain-containing protein [Ruegeria sp.]|nr:NAD(P)-binding domain-containing protein [Ruegeria sp.]